MRDNGMQRTLLLIGRTTPLQADMRFNRNVLVQYLHQTRLANTRLAAQLYHLPQAISRLCSARTQQSHFRLAPHQRREATGAHHI